MRKRHLSLLFLLGSSISLAQTTGAREELTRVTAAYQAIRPPFLIRATVHRRTSQGERWQDVRREYRVGESGGVARVDAGTAGQPPGVTVSRDARTLTLFLAETKASAELAAQAEEAGPIHDLLARAYTLLLGRWASLDAAGVIVVSSRGARVRAAGGRQVAGRRVKLKSGSGGPSRWDGELWIDDATSLVWRARISTYSNGTTVDEDIEWKEVLTGNQVDASLFSWKPPAGGARLTRIPSVLP